MASPGPELSMKRPRLSSTSRPAVGLGQEDSEQRWQSHGESYDFSQSVAQKLKIRKIEEKAQARVRERVCEIIEKEFSRTTHAKESEIETIEDRLLKIKKALHVVRYGAVVNYYAHTVAKQTPGRPDGVSIHPAIRKTIGGKTVTNGKKKEIVNAAEKTVSQHEATIGDVIPKAVVPPTVLPGYVPPKLSEESDPKIERPRGSQNKYRRRLIVGNVSKWIQCDQREDLSTHKWMIYVRGDKNNPDVSNDISKVRFLIHPSYHPHNLVEVTKPPFSLTRRGWGEFPARVQIQFKCPMDKPIDIIHHLKLDKTYTGLQTLGAETVVDVWLHKADFPSREDEEEKSTTKALIDLLEETPEGLVIPHDDIESLGLPESVLKVLQGQESGVSVDERGALMNGNAQSNGFPTEAIKKELAEVPKRISHSPTQGNSKKRDVDQQKRVKKYVAGPNRERKSKQPLQVFHNGISVIRNMTKALPNDSVEDSVSSTSLLRKTPRVLGTQSLPSSPRRPLSPASTSSTPSGSPKARPRMQVTTGKSLLKPGISLLKKNQPTAVTKTELEKAVPGVTLLTWARLLGRNPEDTQAEIEGRVLKRGAAELTKMTDVFSFFKNKVLSLLSHDFQSEEDAMLYLARLMPLVTPRGNDPMYRMLHPYAAPSIKAFKSWNYGRQLASEWLRAKTISRVMTYIFRNASSTRSTSTKTVFQTLRAHGFDIPREVIELSDAGLVETGSCISTLNDHLPNVEAKLENLVSPSKQNHCVSSCYVNVEKGEIDSDEQSAPHPWKVRSGAGSKPAVRLLLPEDNPELFQFVSEAAAEVGVKLGKTEELSDGVAYPAAEKILLRACKNFCERLLRRGHKSAWIRLGNRHPLEVTAGDIREAALKDQQYSFLTHLGLARDRSCILDSAK